MKRLMILLLCLCVFCPSAVLADDTFYMIFGTIADDGLLGEPDALGELDIDSENICLLSFDFPESTVMLFGDDDEGQAYGAAWNNLEDDTMLSLLAYYTKAFKETDEYDTSDFVIQFKFDEEDDDTFIMSENEANAVNKVLTKNGYGSDKPAPASPAPADNPASSPKKQTAVRAKNGEFFVKPAYQSVCPFSVTAASDTDYYIYLEYQKAPAKTTISRVKIANAAKPYEDDVAFYLKAGEQVEIKVPIGVYKLYYATGTVFYGTTDLFGDETCYYSSDDLLSFYTDSRYYQGHTITLMPVSNGNFDTDPIPKNQFPAR